MTIFNKFFKKKKQDKPIITCSICGSQKSGQAMTDIWILDFDTFKIMCPDCFKQRAGEARYNRLLKSFRQDKQ